MSEAVTADPNVDPSEAERFEKLASTWWDAAGPFWPLHRLNALRSGYISRLLASRLTRTPDAERPLSGLRLLDVGCGGGLLSESMAKMGAEVCGIDVVPASIEVAKRHASQAGLPIDYRCTNAADLAGKVEPFDAVLNLEVVEHVPDVQAFIGDCAALVRPGGAMALSTINRNPKSWLFAIVGAEYVLRWLPRGTHQWRRFVTPDEAQRFLASHGLTVSDRTGIKVNPLTRGFSLTSSLAVNYLLMAWREPSNEVNS